MNNASGSKKQTKGRSSLGEGDQSRGQFIERSIDPRRIKKGENSSSPLAVRSRFTFIDPPAQKSRGHL